MVNSGMSCAGGWCDRRDACAHHVNTTGDVEERMCRPGVDLFVPVATVAAPVTREKGATEAIIVALRRNGGEMSAKQIADVAGVDARLVGSHLARYIADGSVLRGGVQRKALYSIVKTQDGVKVERPVAQVGAKFGRLTLIGFAGKDRNGNHLWHCLCDCGAEHAATSNNLTWGSVKSCGCLKREILGHGKTALTVKPALQGPTKAAKEATKVAKRQPQSSNAHLFTKPEPKKGRKPAKPHVDLGPWTPRYGHPDMTPPAKRATGDKVTLCPAPRFHHRYGVNPAEITPLFSAMKPGQYLEAEAA